MHVSIVAHTPIKLEDDGQINQQTHQVDSLYIVPSHWTDEACVHYHHQPGGKGLVQKELRIVLGDGFTS